MASDALKNEHTGKASALPALSHGAVTMAHRGVTGFLSSGDRHGLPNAGSPRILPAVFGLAMQTTRGAPPARSHRQWRIDSPEVDAYGRPHIATPTSYLVGTLTTQYGLTRAPSVIVPIDAKPSSDQLKNVQPCNPAEGVVYRPRLPTLRSMGSPYQVIPLGMSAGCHSIGSQSGSKIW